MGYSSLSTVVHPNVLALSNFNTRISDEAIDGHGMKQDGTNRITKHHSPTYQTRTERDRASPDHLGNIRSYLAQLLRGPHARLPHQLPGPLGALRCT